MKLCKINGLVSDYSAIAGHATPSGLLAGVAPAQYKCADCEMNGCQGFVVLKPFMELHSFTQALYLLPPKAECDLVTSFLFACPIS